MSKSDGSVIPRLLFKKLDEKRQVIEALLGMYVGKTMTPELAITLVSLLIGFFKKPSVDHLMETLVQYTGTEITDSFSKLLAAQLAGRADELTEGPLIAYDIPVRAEWIAVEIVAVEPCTWRDGENGQLLHLYIFTGHPAGHRLKRKVSESFLSFFAYKLGFTRRTQYDYNPLHFIGLRFWGYLKPMPGTAEIEFDEWYLSNSFKQHNQSIIKLRTRYDCEETDAVCPKDYEHSCFDCHESRDTCLAACHLTSQYNRQPLTQTIKNG